MRFPHFLARLRPLPALPATNNNNRGIAVAELVEQVLDDEHARSRVADSKLRSLGGRVAAVAHSFFP